MIPTKVSLSCDNDPFYLDFWEPCSRMWKHKIGVEPVLFFVGDAKDAPKAEHGQVVVVPPVVGHPAYLQALWARYYYVSLFPEDVWIIGDIDMFPLSREFFVDSLSGYEKGDVCHLNTNGDYFPSCYLVGAGDTLTRMLASPPSFEESLDTLVKEPRFMLHHVSNKTCPKWCIDEVYLERCIKAFRERENLAGCTPLLVQEDSPTADA